MGEKVPVSYLSDDALGEIAELVRWKAGLPPTPKDVPSEPETWADTVAVLNVSGFPWPQYGAVWVKTLQSDLVQHKGYVPTRFAHLAMGIACTPVADQAQGRVWVDGIHKVRIQGLSYPTLKAHDRIGTIPNSCDCAKNNDGPLLVLAKWGLDPADPTGGLAMVKFLHRRDGSIFVTDALGTVAADFEHLHFDNSYIVTQPRAGKVHVEVRP